MQQSHLVLRLGDWRGFGNYFQDPAPSFAWKDLSHLIPQRGRNLKALSPPSAASGKVNPSLGDASENWEPGGQSAACRRHSRLESYLPRQTVARASLVFLSPSLELKLMPDSTPSLPCCASKSVYKVKNALRSQHTQRWGFSFFIKTKQNDFWALVVTLNNKTPRGWGVWTSQHLKLKNSKRFEANDKMAGWLSGFQESVCVRLPEWRLQAKVHFKLMIHSFLSTVAEWRDGNWTWKCGLSLPLSNKPFRTTGSHWRGISVL